MEHIVGKEMLLSAAAKVKTELCGVDVLCSVAHHNPSIV
jgi:hypothetical protein